MLLQRGSLNYVTKTRFSTKCYASDPAQLKNAREDIKDLLKTTFCHPIMVIISYTWFTATFYDFELNCLQIGYVFIFFLFPWPIVYELCNSILLIRFEICLVGVSIASLWLILCLMINIYVWDLDNLICYFPSVDFLINCKAYVIVSFIWKWTFYIPSTFFDKELDMLVFWMMFQFYLV